MKSLSAGDSGGIWKAWEAGSVGSGNIEKLKDPNTIKNLVL
jgi:hypothetical protein